MSKKENKKKKKSNILYYIVIFSLIIGVVTLLWARYISTKGLIVREYGITDQDLPKSFNGFKLVQFTDLHYKTIVFEDEVKKLVNTINELKPDIVVFTGDFIDEFVEIEESDIDFLTKEMNKIDATVGKYAVKGNHDYSGIYFDAIFQATDFKILTNASDLIYFNGNIPIYIVGLDDLRKGKPDYNAINNENNYYSILLAHEPDEIDKIKDKNINLMLSGHSHNGQVRLPFFGAFYKVAGAKKYYDPHYVVNNTDLYISGGLGTSKYKLRFFNKPSINFYRFYTN